MRAKVELVLVLVALSIGLVPICFFLKNQIRVSATTPQPPNQTFSESDLRSNQQVKKIEIDANRILAGLKKTCDDFHLKFQGSSEFRSEKGEITFTAYDTPKIELTSKDHKFIFQKDAKHLAVYMVWAQSLLDEQRLSILDTQQWSVAQAIQVGTAFRHILADDEQFRFGPPRTKYTPSSGKGENHREGEWWIYWSKLDANGYPFGSDGVQIHMSETYGVTSATTYLDDSAAKENGTPMSVADAVVIAKKSHPAGGTDSKTIVDYSLKSSDLELVRPYGSAQKPCRLAWVIWLQPIRSPGTPFLGYDDSQEVSVDALNGQIVGNDWMM